jgi:hypothetical protein
MVLVALVVVVLLTGGLALAAASLAERQRAVLREADALRLTALTDAAVAETLARLAAWPGFRGVSRRSFAGGALGSEVRAYSDGDFEILAWGEYGGRRRAIQARGRFAGSDPVVLGWLRITAAEGQRLGLAELP